MPTSFEALKDLRGQGLRNLKSLVLRVKTSTWGKLRPVVLRVIVWFVSIYRLTLRKAVFIGVNGSVGKTTAKEMIAVVLGTRYQGYKSPGNINVLGGVIRSVVRTRREHDFCVQEFNVGGIGEAVSLETQYKMFRPSIGVMTTVGDDHISAHGSREAIAAAKGKMIAALPATGTAILNADDPLVVAMRSRCKGRTITYGLSSDAMLRAVDVDDDWPNRLSLTVQYEGESVRVQTQYCGAHLVPSLLAAMAVGRTMGVSLQSAATALEGLAPVPGRMFPVECPDGVTFIRDDVKAPVWAIPSALDYMRRATAKRKIVIIGSLSDYQTPLDPTYASVARQARDVADHVFFVGRWATRGLRGKRHPKDDAVKAFVTIDHLNGFLEDFLEPGDLVLLKGSHPDKLSSIVTAWTNKVEGPPAAERPALDGSALTDETGEAPTPSIDRAIMQGVTQLVVGLGNPGKRFEQTPHNVGQQTLDLVAEMLEVSWSEEEIGLVARAQVQDQQVLLVKPPTAMNRTGPWMRQMADQGNLKDQDCLIVHDDIHLKPGVVRNRLSGSSGGHKGVQSIIAAFQSEDIRRVKIGVGLPTDGTAVERYVLTPFNASESETAETACRKAATRVLEMIKAHPVSN